MVSLLSANQLKEYDKMTEIISLMGKNIFNASDWAIFYGIHFSKVGLYKIGKFPWDEEVLLSTCPLCGKTIKDCHFAFIGLSSLDSSLFNIIKLQELHPVATRPRFKSYGTDSWYHGEEFAKTTMHNRWHLLHIRGIPGSENKVYDEQRLMLPERYEVPNAVTELTKNLLIFKKTGAFVNYNRLNRCRDTTSKGYQVEVGGYSYENSIFDCFWAFDRDYESGIATSQKYPY
ncbi:MAG: hypothetical protein V1819_03550 [bacterium]